MFSIVIPSYNRADLLLRALQSVDRQTFRDFEVLVSDDASRDNTSEVVAAFADRFALKFLRQEHNSGGPARPRNAAVAEARYDWVCFLDADDWWLDTKLESIKACIDAFAPDVIYHNLLFARDGKPTGKEMRARVLKSPVFQDLLVNGNTLPTSSVAIRRSVLQAVGEFCEDPQLVAVEDFDFWIRAAKVTEKFHFLNVPLGYYDASGNNISAVAATKVRTRHELVVSRHASLLSKSDRRRAAGAVLYIYGAELARSGQYRLAARAFIMAILKGSSRIRGRGFIRLFGAVLGYPRQS